MKTLIGVLVLLLGACDYNTIGQMQCFTLKTAYSPTSVRITGDKYTREEDYGYMKITVYRLGKEVAHVEFVTSIVAEPWSCDLAQPEEESR